MTGDLGEPHPPCPGRVFARASARNKAVFRLVLLAAALLLFFCCWWWWCASAFAVVVGVFANFGVFFYCIVPFVGIFAGIFVASLFALFCLAGIAFCQHFLYLLSCSFLCLCFCRCFFLIFS